MRFDSRQWYPQNSDQPKPVKSKSYLLMCETRDASKPLPVIRWYRNGRAVRNNRHFYIIVSFLTAIHYVGTVYRYFNKLFIHISDGFIYRFFDNVMSNVDVDRCRIVSAVSISKISIYNKRSDIARFWEYTIDFKTCVIHVILGLAQPQSVAEHFCIFLTWWRCVN